VLLLGMLAPPGFSLAQSLAPGFHELPKHAKVAVMPSDIELFELTAGGIMEPKAEWTETASRHFRNALLKKERQLGMEAVEIGQDRADDLAEVNAVHAAVARAITMHHLGTLQLPTKGENLDWSLGDAAQIAKQATGADYALFTWIRDSYASAGRQAFMAAFTVLAIAGGGAGAVRGGAQVGYASLVDLSTGRVVWFNRLQRGSGDLREADRAEETLDALLSKFPVAK
jgi:hypothetical protein